VTYPYTMVGTDPYTTNTTTTIPVTIIPISFTFASHAANVNSPTLDGSTKIANMLASPIFNETTDIGTAANTTASPPPGGGVAPSPRLENEPSDVTQVSNAIYRSQFGKSGTGYNVLLGHTLGANFTILPTQFVNAPQNQGIETHGSVSGADLGRIDVNWFSPRLKEFLGQLHTDEHTLVIFGTYNIVL
jgi:hypothetical protein